jgi:hypothetical protein
MNLAGLSGSDSLVRVEVVELEPGGSRQISSAGRATELLLRRADDIKSAVAEISAIVQAGAGNIDEVEGWRVSKLEATFGLTLTAESGVIVAKGSAQAVFEVTLTIDRR